MLGPKEMSGSRGFLLQEGGDILAFAVDFRMRLPPKHLNTSSINQLDMSVTKRTINDNEGGGQRLPESHCTLSLRTGDILTPSAYLL